MSNAPDNSASTAAPQHNPYNPYNPYSPRTSTLPAGATRGYAPDSNHHLNNHTMPAEANSYEMKSPPSHGASHSGYKQKDIEASAPSRTTVRWQDRMVCGMRTKWLIILIIVMVLAFVAASLGGILGSEKAIEDNKEKIAAAKAAAKAARQKIAAGAAA